jgi:DNA-binding response OmpR family regulator
MIAALANMIGRLAAEALDRQQLSPLSRPRATRRPSAEHLLPCLLLIEADPVARSRRARLLEGAGFAVQVASCGQEALAALDVGFPDAVLVCCSPGDTPDLSLGQVIRGVADLPIAMLGAAGDGETIASALDTFADEYLAYSISDAELVARLRRIVRRSRGAAPPEPIASTAVDERLTLQLARREAVVGGRTVKLTPIEARLLGSLARRPNRPVPTAALLGEAWPDGDGDQTQLWVHIRSLRRKLEVDADNPRYLVTLRGQGYMLATAKQTL